MGMMVLDLHAYRLAIHVMYVPGGIICMLSHMTDRFTTSMFDTDSTMSLTVSGKLR